MMLFTIAVTFNCVAILAIAVNAVHDAIHHKHSEDHNFGINAVGFLYQLVVVLSFYLYNNTNSLAATIISSAMAVPVAGAGLFLFVSSVRKPVWK